MFKLKGLTSYRIQLLQIIIKIIISLCILHTHLLLCIILHVLNYIEQHLFNNHNFIHYKKYLESNLKIFVLNFQEKKRKLRLMILIFMNLFEFKKKNYVRLHPLIFFYNWLLVLHLEKDKKKKVHINLYIKSKVMKIRLTSAFVFWLLFFKISK